MCIKCICILLSLWEFRGGCGIFNTFNVLCSEFLHSGLTKPCSAWLPWNFRGWHSSALWDTCEHVDVELAKILQGKEKNCITRVSRTGLTLSQLFLICSVTHPHSALIFFLTYFLPTYGLNCDSLFPFYHPLPTQSYDRWHTWTETARDFNRTLSESQQITQCEHLLGVCSMTNGLEQALNV